MSHANNSISLPEEFVSEELTILEDQNETGADPKQKPEVEPEHLPKEDPGQPGVEPGEDDDDDDDPFKETEIGDDPDEIEKKTTIFNGK